MNPALSQWIEDARKKGYSDGHIHKHLTGYGFHPEDVIFLLKGRDPEHESEALWWIIILVEVIIIIFAILFFFNVL